MAHAATEVRMDLFRATGLIEGFVEPENPEDPEPELLEAWQFIVDTGAAWKLQGFYGRTASMLIDQGAIRPMVQ